MIDVNDIDTIVKYEVFTSHPINSNGIVYPDDSTLRKSLFVPEVMQHPAKANIYMIQDMYRYVSEPGETIMDIMSGTGTLMVANWDCRNVVLLELVPLFHVLQQQSRAKMLEQVSEGSRTLGVATLLHGDCREYLPLPCDHIIYSPPYSNIMTAKPKAESSIALAGSTYTDDFKDGSVWEQYHEDDRNFGRLNTFQYNRQITKVYQQCFDSISPGGTLSVILKDRIVDNKRVFLSDWLLRSLLQIGFELEEWFKRESLGTGYLKLWRSRGHNTVDDEDIIIFRRP